MRCWLLPVCLFAGMLAPSLVGAESPTLLRDLVDTAGFSRSDIERNGDSGLARELDVADRARNAAFAGIIRIRTRGEALAPAIEKMDVVKSPLEAHAFGRFTNPTRPENVADLEFQDSDLEVLADCELSQCKFKLSEEGIDALASIDWGSENAGVEFTKLFRVEALTYVDQYRRDGSSGLILYRDKSDPLNLGKTLASLVEQFAALRRDAPEFSKYLVSYPAGGRPSVSDSITWAVMDFGYRPTLSIDQFFIDRTPEQAGVLTLIAAKTIYANHYLAGRMQIGALIDGAEALGIPGHFIVLVDRIRFDDELSGFKRSLLARGLSSDVEGRLKFLRSLADSGK
jgi:hypothetical protein